MLSLKVVGWFRGFAVQCGRRSAPLRSREIEGIKDIIAVASGKGGVGKSTTAVNLAVSLAKNCNLKVGLLDADVYGPSIPTMMKLKGKPEISTDKKMVPIENYGVKCISMGSLVAEGDAIVWRGLMARPRVMKALEQLTRGVRWGALDILVVDMPPGTGDAQISISQRLQLSGAVIVSTPQDVALMDARRGVKMFSKVNVPILGILENMSYFKCPNCSEPYYIFGRGGAQRTADEMGMKFLGEVMPCKIPLETEIRRCCDDGIPVASSNPDSLMQNQAAVSFKSDYALLHPRRRLKPLRNPRLSPPRREEFRFHSLPKCGAIEIPVAKQQQQRLNPLTLANGLVEGERIGSVGGKDIDVATLGNLCVDVVLNVSALPPESVDERKAYLEELSKSPPDKKHWEAGGNCNMAIAAARLGMRVVAVGHVGDEIYGHFLLDVLRDEGIVMIEINEENDRADTSAMDYETLICWVLVDPLHRHAFCSRADFSEKPAFAWLWSLSAEAKTTIRRSKTVFFNGYCFDELSPHLLVSALSYATEVGTSVFFDPGPRGKSLVNGTPEERRALDEFLRFSDVLLLTSEEAESLTGIRDPILAGEELLRRGVRTKWVIIKMGARGSVMITHSSISCAPGFKVKVIDTVGCGDSFVAAVAFGYIHKLPSINTLAVANAVGAATAMGCGAGRNVARLKQVVELVTESNLNEDDEFWEQLPEERQRSKGVSAEVTLLSKLVVDGSENLRVPLQRVVAELLAMLEVSEMAEQVDSTGL
ncbi:hypothetical protein M569_09279 [Genlisea aurea]|uniref:Nucleotide-binding protein-like n=1 Tax=Genlisea aurea TaxID=192259 RepID=S8CL76_9LAMI|nr:hypothetical protein M569_09279 [Genlisea aurea]